MCPDIEAYAPLHPGRLRARRPAGRGRAPRAPAPAAAGRPRAVQHQPAARRRGRARRAGRRPRHRDRGARPGVGRAGAAAVRVHRRRPGPAGDVGRPGRRSGGGSTPATGATYGLGAAPHNTWETGLEPDAARGRRWPGTSTGTSTTRCPLDDVSSGDIDLVGRFTEYVDRLRRFVDAAEAATTIGQWVGALSSGVEQLTAVPMRDAWQQAQFDRELAEDHATRPATRDEHAAAAARTSAHLLAHRLGGRPTRANFRTGTLTVCTMVPMRSVPHRVVCLLGLDDGVVPAQRVGRRGRRARPRPDDRGAGRAQRGPAAVPRRDPGGQRDAGDHLHRRQRAHRGRAAAGGAAGRAAGRARRRRSSTAPCGSGVLRRSTRCSRSTRATWWPASSPATRPFSFDRAALAGAAGRPPAARRRRPTLLAEPLPREAAAGRRARRPAGVPRPPGARVPALRGSTSPRRSRPRRRSTRSRSPSTGWRSGRSATGCWPTSSPAAPAGRRRAEQLRGDLPPGPLGGHALQEIVDHLSGLIAADRRRCAQGDPRTVDVDIDLGGGRRLTGTVRPSAATGSSRCRYSSLGRQAPAARPGSTCSR